MTENEEKARGRREQLIVTLNDVSKSNERRREGEETRPAVIPSPDKAKVQAKFKKESFWSKFKKAFFGENVDNVGEYMVFDVGIPALKATISDMFSNGLEVLLFGEARGRRSKRDDNTRYARMYRSSDRDRDYDRDRDRDSRRDDIRDYRDIYFDSKKEARDFISEVYDYVQDYGRITIAVYMSIAGVRTNAWDYNHKGWYKDDLANAIEPVRTQYGWEIDIPKPVRVD